jgi:signal transduction histidine kinase
MPASPTNPWRVFALVLALTLAVFGALVAALTLTLRRGLRDGVLRREAASIHAVAQLQIAVTGMPLTAAGADDPLPDLFAAVVESSRLQGVLAVQLFDPKGQLRDALPPVAERNVTTWWPPRLDDPAVRFEPRGALENVFGVATSADVTRAPLLEVIVPLRAPDRTARVRPVLGTARYWIDGAPVARELAGLDRALLGQAAAAFAGGGAMVTLVLSWAFARLLRANRALAARSADLARANQELTFAAKTGAIGAISAHLIHGLKNPLSGLEGFVAENAAAPSATTDGEAWRLAVDTTRRLRELVNEVVGVLRDDADSAPSFEIPAAEIADAAIYRTTATASAAGVTVTRGGAGSALLAARTGNLARLVLANLLTNAIEASPRGSQVEVEIIPGEAGVEFLVRDFGSGIPVAIRDRLFQPLRSAKPGGGGIGLAISRQIAQHAGGELDLADSGEHGTAFRLRVPATVVRVR